ncbi:hypothetical protein FA13DRAFT_1779949 [Coprinellus micaceus]|uniref:Uncharacterized protein n=1 Tax=Coprinellus micaceus TaxID=71717 RepID=A0A4Y7SEP0_COPMI|nr:hypothetical protein FA13DRAFT_1779949 [Coprinellus micaceus]
MIAITGVSLDGSGEGRQRTSTTPLREQEGKGGIATIAGVRRQEAEKNKQYLTARILLPPARFLVPRLQLASEEDHDKTQQREGKGSMGGGTKAVEGGTGIGYSHSLRCQETCTASSARDVEGRAMSSAQSKRLLAMCSRNCVVRVMRIYVYGRDNANEVSYSGDADAGKSIR